MGTEGAQIQNQVSYKCKVLPEVPPSGTDFQNMVSHPSKSFEGGNM